MSSDKDRPRPLEAVRLALAELGAASDAEVAAFVQEHFDIPLQPQYVPVARASLRGLEQLEAARRAAREALAQVQAEPRPRGRRRAGAR